MVKLKIPKKNLKNDLQGKNSEIWNVLILFSIFGSDLYNAYNLSNLYNKTRHSYIYILRIAGQMAGPIGLKFFVETYKWPGGCYRLKNSKNFFPQATPGPSAYTYIHSCNNVIFFFPIWFFKGNN